jgi:hypothetical protein
VYSVLYVFRQQTRRQASGLKGSKHYPNSAKIAVISVIRNLEEMRFHICCSSCFSTHPVSKKPSAASINRSESYKERVHQKVSELETLI